MENFELILPEIFISLSIMFLLILGVFKKDSSRLIQNISLIVLLIIRFLSSFMFIYGKRRLVLSLMLGFIFGYLSKIYLDSDLSSIGNIIPGLLASWMDRQGVLQTISVLIIIAVATRLILIALLGGLYYV